jgi:hypothetical protein
LKINITQVERVSKAATPYLSQRYINHPPPCLSICHVCVCIYIYIPIPHVTSHPITYLSYLLYTPILVMSCISCLHWQCLMMTWHYLLPLLTLNPKIYSLIGIKNKFLFRLPWNMEGMFLFIYLFLSFWFQL